MVQHSAIFPLFRVFYLFSYDSPNNTHICKELNHKWETLQVVAHNVLVKTMMGKGVVIISRPIQNAPWGPVLSQTHLLGFFGRCVCVCGSPQTHPEALAYMLTRGSVQLGAERADALCGDVSVFSYLSKSCDGLFLQASHFLHQLSC